MTESEKEKLAEMSVEEILNLALKNFFPKKLFIIKNARKYYRPRLHFFTSLRIFIEKPKEHVKFECKICKIIIQATFPAFNNLNNHLKVHEQFRTNWLSYFNKANNNGKSAILDDNIYDLVRFVISSNFALDQLENPFFFKLLDDKMKIPCKKSIRYDILPAVFENLKDAIENKLNSALSLCLVVDIWTNRVMADFLIYCLR